MWAFVLCFIVLVIMLVKGGRNKLEDSDRISDRSLGLSGASWVGMHRALTDDRY